MLMYNSHVSFTNSANNSVTHHLAHFILRVITMLFIAAIVVACSESKETRTQRFLAQGNDMLTKQNFEEAITYYQGALKLDSCFVDALNNLGTVYFRQNNFTQALDYYTRAISCKPDFISAYINRANTYYELNELFSALQDLNRVEKFKSDTVILHFSRGLIFTKMRNYPKAKNSFQRGLRLDPANTELLTNVASVYYFEHQYDSAKLYLTPVIGSLDPEPNAFNTMALIHIETERYDEALEMISRALELDPRNPYFINNRGLVYLMKSEMDKGLADINESIAMDPYNGWAYRNKGIYYLKKGKAEQAIEMLLRAHGLDSDIREINFYLAEAYWRQGNKTLACSYYKKAVERKELPEDVLEGKCKG